MHKPLIIANWLYYYTYNLTTGEGFMKKVWQGTLSYGLVISLELYHAQRKPFYCKILHSKCFFEIENQLCSHCNERVQASDIVKEVKFGTEHEFLKNEEKIQFDSFNNIEILELIDTYEISSFNFDEHYFLVPRAIDTNYFLFTRLLHNLRKIAFGRIILDDKLSYCVIKQERENFVLMTLATEKTQEMTFKVAHKEVYAARFEC